MDSEPFYLEVIVKPRASRESITGWVGNSLKVSVTAPPVEGKANSALCAYLACLIGVPRSQVSVVSGSGSRKKLVRILGITAAEARSRLEAAMQAKGAQA